MDITEVRIRLVESGSADKLLAFASITLDGEFVVRDMKIIEGNKGLFVAMPSRRIMDRCPHCSNKNPVRSRYCNNCGKSLPVVSNEYDNGDDFQKGHADVAHPITPSCRERIHKAVMKAYDEAQDNAKKNRGYPKRSNFSKGRSQHEVECEYDTEESSVPKTAGDDDGGNWGMF